MKKLEIRRPYRSSWRSITGFGKISLLGSRMWASLTRTRAIWVRLRHIRTRVNSLHLQLQKRPGCLKNTMFILNWSINKSCPRWSEAAMSAWKIPWKSVSIYLRWTMMFSKFIWYNLLCISSHAHLKTWAVNPWSVPYKHLSTHSSKLPGSAS